MALESTQPLTVMSKAK